MKHKKLVCKCGAKFDEYNWDKSRHYTMCWKCWSTQPARITDYEKNEEDADKYREGYASQKDFDEANEN